MAANYMTISTLTSLKKSNIPATLFSKMLAGEGAYLIEGTWYTRSTKPYGSTEEETAFFDIKKIAKLWASHHDYKGMSGGWIYYGPNMARVCQGWGEFASLKHAQIVDWLTALAG